jgi:hypothetical protein
MTKPNPKNFKPFVDPDGGEWIQVTGASKYAGVTWRPINIEMKDDDGTLAYEIEQLTGEGTESVIQDSKFQELASAVILDILQNSLDQNTKSKV